MLLLAALASTSAGCVPLVWALPPLQYQVGGGARVEPVADDVGLGIDARIGVHPLGAFEQLLDRNFDIGLGYAYALGPIPASHLHGLFLEGQLLHGAPAKGGFGRWSLGVQGHVIRPTGPFDPAQIQPVAGRVALQGGWSWIRFADSEARARVDTGGSSVSILNGEVGIGVYGELSYARLGGRYDFWTATIGVRLVSPATVGAGLFWLDPENVGDDRW
jgi:hypothetical protein